MTVNSETPLVRYVGDGESGSFSFGWSSQAIGENYAQIDGSEKVYLVDYVIDEYTEGAGGVIRFLNVPAAGAEVVIFRRTPITQQLDYTEFTRFPAETHEAQMDKDTRILQEQESGIRSNDGAVDLSAVQTPDNIQILNSAGTGVTLDPWKTNGSEAGIFLGQVLDSIPIDGAATSQPDGFVYIEVANINTNSQIVMTNEPVAAYNVRRSPSFAARSIQYDQYGRLVWASQQDPDSDQPEFFSHQAIQPEPTALEQFWIQALVDPADVAKFTSGRPVNTWIDTFDLGVTISWGISQSSVGVLGAIMTVQIAPDNGAGAPDLTNIVSKSFSLTCEVVA